MYDHPPYQQVLDNQSTQYLHTKDQEPTQIVHTTQPDSTQNQSTPLLSELPNKQEKKVSQIQIQPTYQHHEEVFFGCCRKSPHMLSLLFNLFLLASIIFIIVAGILYGTNPSRNNKTVLIVAGCVLPVAFIAYIIEAFCSSTYSYLANLLEVEDIVTHINRIRDTAPVLRFHCECYHYETRLVTVSYTETDSNGVTRTRHRTETREEKVVTYTESERFEFRAHNDTSGVVSNELLTFNAIRIDFTKQWNAGDQMTADTYSSRYMNFKLRNQFRDTHFNAWETFDVPGFESKMLAIVDINKKNKMLSAGWYTFFTLLLLNSWAYRIWMDSVSVKAKYHFNKTIYI
ncbi:hypothetical protein AKO1_009098 [Acrasis kona]|uniref:Transmembrane protein 206 n=1 Tax=Acrasis kona TaxID=1008807 RepID=A0AAW2ZHL1_9EUKA